MINNLFITIFCIFEIQKIAIVRFFLNQLSDKNNFKTMNEFQIKTITVPKQEWDKVMNTLEVLHDKISRLVTNDSKEFLTKKEVMSLLKIGRTTLDRYIEEGLLEEVKLGTGTRGYIKQSQIDDLMGKSKCS